MESLPTDPPRGIRPPPPPGQRGAALLHLVAGLALIGALAAGLAALTSLTLQTGLGNLRQKRAYYLALSGLGVWTAGTTGTFSLPDGSFTLAQTGPDADGYYTVTSRGTVLGGSALEANAVLSARRPGLAPISFSQDLAGFQEPVVGKTASNAKAITVIAAAIASNAVKAKGEGAAASDGYASGALRLGGGAANNSGAIWYTGNHGACAGSNCLGVCLAGRCTLGKGLRACFGFVFADADTSTRSTDHGDGFTFTLASAQANDPSTASGGPRSGVRAEYLGYAGPGPSGCGIAAPKLAVELDTYPNKNAYPPELTDSRRDQSDANHLAAVFWGDPATLFDDNVHGVGTAPRNPTAEATNALGYHAGTKNASGANWLEDAAEHTLRLEIHRADQTSGGTYAIKVWIDKADAALADVTRDYTATAPDLDYVATLSAADHVKLDTVYFGWTEASGSGGQNVTIHDFSLDFRR